MAFCFQTSQCRKTSHLDMQLLVSSQMEAGMEEVLDEMVVGVQKGNNWVQGGNIRQAGQGAPPGNGVCTVCTIRYTEMTQIKSTIVGCGLTIFFGTPGGTQWMRATREGGR